MTMAIQALLGLLAVLQIALAAWLGWLLVLAGAAVRARQTQSDPPPERLHRLVALIPAHDEEAGIGRTVASIRQAGYPEELLDIFVVADNCRDRTAAEAEAAGARTVIRQDEDLRGKGYALQAGIEAIRKSGNEYEAYLFFDADTLAAPGFLHRMSLALDQGHAVVQGRYSVADPDRTWFTRLTHLGFVLKNFFQFPGLETFGLSVPLRGSGMCFRCDIMDRFGWGSTSLTEDFDFSITLIEAGLRTHFDFLAENHQYMPPTPAAARIQRARWSAGEAQTISGRLKGLLLCSLGRGDLRGVLQAIFMAMPPLSVLLVLNLGLVFIFSLGVALGVSWVVWPLGLASVATLGYGAYFLSGLTITGLTKGYVVAVVMIPVYAVWRAAVHLWSALPGRARQMAWRKTERV